MRSTIFDQFIGCVHVCHLVTDDREELMKVDRTIIISMDLVDHILQYLIEIELRKADRAIVIGVSALIIACRLASMTGDRTPRG